MMQSPYFRFPPLKTSFRVCEKISKLTSFQEKFTNYHRPQFPNDFLKVIYSKFALPHYFCIIYTFPHFGKTLFFTFLYIPPYFHSILVFLDYITYLLLPPILTMMHLCITKNTYWKPLSPDLPFGEVSKR